MAEPRVVVCKSLPSLDGGVMMTEFWTDKQGKRHEEDHWVSSEDSALQNAKDVLTMSSKMHQVTIHKMPGRKILCRRKEDWR